MLLEHVHQVKRDDNSIRISIHWNQDNYSKVQESFITILHWQIQWISDLVLEQVSIQGQVCLDVPLIPIWRDYMLVGDIIGVLRILRVYTRTSPASYGWILVGECCA